MQIFSRSRNVVPETTLTSPTHDELVIRVNTLAAEVARLNIALRKLTVPTPLASTVGPVPASPAEGTSGRSLIRYIAHKLGKNEDGVRHSLEHSPMFADLRDNEPKLATNVPIMRWLAGEFDGQMRYVWLASGAATAAELVGGRGA